MKDRCQGGDGSRLASGEISQRGKYVAGKTQMKRATMTTPWSAAREYEIAEWELLRPLEQRAGLQAGHAERQSLR